MKLCIFTNHFYPEDFKVNDIAFELAKRGYDITVITAVPDYPQGKFFDGYSLFKRRKEKINEVLVYRLPVIPRGKGRLIELVINYASYFISVLIFTVCFLYEKEYDAIFVHLTSPFFIGFPAVLLKKQLQIPLIFWVLDLWPESIFAASNINNRIILNIQIKLVQYVYRNCDQILIGSQGFKDSICEKGDYAKKIVYFPNWAENVVPSEDAIKYLNLEPFKYFNNNDFIILFAGNIGEAQNLFCVLDAAFLLKEIIQIKFIFMGNGRKRDELKNYVYSRGLSKTVFFPGRYPLDSMPVLMRRADVLLVSLKDEKIFNFTVPSKVQFYMAQGKPVLAMLNGDGAKIIKEACCGITVPANDSIALKEAVIQFINLPKEELVNMGENGKNYYVKYFSKEQRINQLEKIITSNQRTPP